MAVQTQIFVQQSTGHNKFWIIEHDSQTNNVTRKWGRLGTKGQQKTESFPTAYAATSFVRDKVSGQRGDGYKPIDKNAFNKANLEAMIIGTQNKCHKLRWVEPDGQSYKEVSEDRLQDPSYNPMILIDIETRKAYDGRTTFTILLDQDATYIVNRVSPAYGHSISPLVKTNATIVAKGNPLYDLTMKLQEVVARSIAG